MGVEFFVEFRVGIEDFVGVEFLWVTVLALDLSFVWQLNFGWESRFFGGPS